MSLLEQIVPSSLGVLVHLGLRRKAAATLAITTVVDDKDGKPHTMKPSDVFDVAADIQIVAMEVEECRCGSIVGAQPPTMQGCGVARANGQPYFLILQVKVGRRLLHFAAWHEDQLSLLGP